MESGHPVTNSQRSISLAFGVLLPLLLVAVALLVLTFPVTAADTVQSKQEQRAIALEPSASAWLAATVHSALAESAASEPDRLELDADPTTILADGASVSTLTAEVWDPSDNHVPDGTVVVFTTDAGTFPGALTTTPHPIGSSTPQAESSLVDKSGGTWIEYDDSNALNGKGVYSDDMGDEIRYSFTATSIKVLFQKQWNAGIAHVYLDGVLLREIDTYADPTQYHVEELIAEDLPYALHEVVVVVSGDKNPSSDGSAVVVDAFRKWGHNQNGAYLTTDGIATVDLTSDPAPGTASVEACAGLACDLAEVEFVSAKPVNLDLSADPTSILADGASVSTLTAEVWNGLDDHVPDGTVVVFTTDAGTFPGGLTTTHHPIGSSTPQAEGGLVDRTGGTWIPYTNGNASGGGGVYSDQAGDEISYSFTATSIKVLFQKQPSTGIAHVYLDGILLHEIDTYADPTEFQVEVLIAEDLPYAPHEVVVVVSGDKNISSTGIRIVVDAFREWGRIQNGAYLTTDGLATVDLTSWATTGTASVEACAGLACDSAEVELVSAKPVTLDLSADPTSILADGASASTLTAEVWNGFGDHVPDGTVVVFTTDAGTFPGALTTTPHPIGSSTPQAEGGLVDRTGGTWIPYTNASASGGGGVYSDQAGDEISYSFTATSIKVLFQKQPNAGIAHVYLDGILLRIIDTYADPIEFQVEELIAEDLPYAPHEVVVVVSGDQNPSSDGNAVVVDAFRKWGHNQNGAYLTTDGLATVDLTSEPTPGSASVEACAGLACDTQIVHFRLFTFLPVILKPGPPEPPDPPDPPPPVIVCDEWIKNGGFENGTNHWFVGPTPRPARHTTERKHSGDWSMLLGIKPGETDKYSYSSVRQAITLPSNTLTATLTFWHYRVSDLDTGDRQQALVLDQDDNLIEILMSTNKDTRAWRKKTYDLSAYAGSTIKVYFNALNDNVGTGVTSFYLDDVSVELCTTDGPVDPPDPPVPPAGCYPVLTGTIGVGDKPHGVALKDNGRRAYVGNHADNSLSVLNTVTFGPVTTKAIGNGPNGAAYNPNNNRVYIANRNSNTVSAVRLSDYHVKTINVGSQPNGVAVNEVTNRIYVANFNDGTVSKIRGSDNTVVDTIAVGSQPSMIAVNPNTNKAYVSLHGEGKVAVIDGAGSMTPVNIFSAGPYGIAVDTHRNLVYVATIDTSRIAVIDGSDDSFEVWVEIKHLNSGIPVPLRMIAVNPLIGTSGHIFATTAGSDGGFDKVLMFPKGYPEGFARPYALDLDEPREGIAFDPNTYRVYVTSRADDLVAVYQDGEPTCPGNLESLDDFQLKICVAAKDGSCSEVYYR